MPLTGKEFVRKAEKEGWIVDRIKGSHYILTKDNKTIVVPVHSGKTLPTGLYNELVRTAGLKF